MKFQKKSRILLLVCVLAGWIGCSDENAGWYITLPEDYRKTFNIHIDRADYLPLQADQDGNYFIKLDTAVYTSTGYHELKNRDMYFRVGEENEYLTDKELESKYHVKMEMGIRAYKAKSETEMLPHVLEISISEAQN